MRLSALIAVSAWLLTIGVGLGAFVIRFLRPDPIPPNAFGMGAAGMVAFVILGITWATVGGVLVARRPANVVGPIVMVVGLGYAASIFWTAWTAIASAQDPSGMASRVFGWLTGLSTLSGIGLFYLALIFPSGRGHSPSWHRLSESVLVMSAATAVTVLLQPGPLHIFPGLDNPFGFGLDLRPVFGGRVAPFVALGAAAFLPVLLVGLASRYRAAGQVERLQLRWFFSSIVLTAIALAVVAAAGLGGNAALGEAPLVAFALAGTTVPIAIGIAILRHHLYDLDRLISRTIGWALLSGALVGVFAVGVIGLQAALSTVTQGQTLAVAASTLVAFALFQPLSRRIQRAVDRRFDRARYDAERTAGEFAERVRNQVDLDAVTDDLARTCRSAVRPAGADVWLRGAG